LARRVNLPAADDLFRPTTDPDADRGEKSAAERPARGGQRRPVAAVPEPAQRAEAAEGKSRQPSGRVRHDEKMTVYVTADELVDIEHARLMLRRDHGLAVDRGRLVREALAIVLADLEEQGDYSELIRRLLR
jgi:hypothetical protein